MIFNKMKDCNFICRFIKKVLSRELNLLNNSTFSYI